MNTDTKSPPCKHEWDFDNYVMLYFCRWCSASTEDGIRITLTKK